GSLDDRSFVITEDHHIDYLLNSELEKKIPPKILKILKDSSILFLGYSLNDYDLQLILHQSWVKNLFDTKSSWFIHKSRPGSLEAKLWEKRGVTLIDSTIEEGLTQLESGIDFRLREAGKYD
ncbi:MAG: SIR2 family protein, partial [Coleofasciculus sp. S288]|nr:SIR2 family protein [Coleofasciculus sp. S288]